MNACSQKLYGDHPWQATLPGMLRNIKEEFERANATKAVCFQPVRKKLTTEAIFMLCIVLLFVILTLIRSSISIYEKFESFGKEKHSSIIKRQEKKRDGNSHVVGEKKTSSNSVFLTNLRRFLDCFCIERNVKKLFSFVSTEEQLSFLHGIRSITVIWVLTGHVSMFYVGTVKTPGKFQSFLDLQGTQILKNAIFIVDTFLILSGFLNGYLFSQQYERRNGKISLLTFYTHRFLRLTPLYYIVLGFYATLFPYLGSGLVWPTYDTNPVCKENFVWHALYINNFNSHSKQCLAPTWYLPCEMQLYIISPIFLILLMRRPKMGYFLLFLGILGSCYINFIFTKEYRLIDGVTRLGDYYSSDLKLFQTRFWEYYDLLYSKPYSRIGTFFFGMALGCYLFQKRKFPIKKISKIKLFLGWIMFIILFWTSILALYGREESIMESAVYNGLKHPLFACGVSWIIYLCVTGQGGVVNKFLSSKIFILISRLSYTIYLTHLIVLEGYFLSLEDLIEHSVLQVIFHISMALMIIPASVVPSVLFEAPIVRITALFSDKADQETKADKQK